MNKRCRGKSKPVVYDEASHRSWANENNLGVCHFSVLPANYKISCLVHDMFHCRVNIVKQRVGYIQDLMDNSYENLEKFSLILFLLESWGDYKVSHFISNNSISKLKGHHTKSFTTGISKIEDTIQTLCIPRIVNKIYDALQIFKWMSGFLGLVIITNFSVAKLFLKDQE